MDSVHRMARAGAVSVHCASELIGDRAGESAAIRSSAPAGSRRLFCAHRTSTVTPRCDETPPI